MNTELTFKALEQANLERYDRFNQNCHDWTFGDWGCAMAGEAGECCNLLKKIRRGDPINPDEVAKELADIVVYCDLIAMKLDIDLGEAVRAKFNEVSDRYGCPIKL